MDSKELCLPTEFGVYIQRGLHDTVAASQQKWCGNLCWRPIARGTNVLHVISPVSRIHCPHSFSPSVCVECQDHRPSFSAVYYYTCSYSDPVSPADNNGNFSPDTPCPAKLPRSSVLPALLRTLWNSITPRRDPIATVPWCPSMSLSSPF